MEVMSDTVVRYERGVRCIRVDCAFAFTPISVIRNLVDLGWLVSLGAAKEGPDEGIEVIVPIEGVDAQTILDARRRAEGLLMPDRSLALFLLAADLGFKTFWIQWYHNRDRRYRGSWIWHGVIGDKDYGEQRDVGLDGSRELTYARLIADLEGLLPAIAVGEQIVKEG